LPRRPLSRSGGADRNRQRDSDVSAVPRLDDAARGDAREKGRALRRSCFRSRHKGGVRGPRARDALCPKREITPTPTRLLKTSQQERTPVTVSIAHLQPIVSLIAGVLILMMPRLLNYIVAFYLIVSGVIGLGLVH
jgi:hypothetical protein